MHAAARAARATQTGQIISGHEREDRAGTGGVRAPERAVSESAIRIVVTAGREAVRRRSTGEPTRTDVEPGAYRLVARALLGGVVDRDQISTAVQSFSRDEHGSERFAAMAARAQQSLVTTDPDLPGESVSVDRVAAVLGVHGLMLRALHAVQERDVARSEQFASAAASVANSSGYQDVCQRSAEAMLDLSGLAHAAMFTPGEEHARVVRAAYAGDQHGSGPAYLRIDQGLFADAIASERPLFLSGAEPTTELPASLNDARTLLAVPLRDSTGRPVGLLIAWDTSRHMFDPDSTESVRRLGIVVQGIVESEHERHRRAIALEALPELAHVAHGQPADVHVQLDELAAIVVRATDSDAAVMRLRDPAGRYLETPAAATRHGEAVGDAIGTRTRLSGIDPSSTEISTGEHELVDINIELPGDPRLALWSEPGRRLLGVLGARTIGIYPVVSRHQRDGVLYVIRKTARPFDEFDRACVRIITAHAQHVIDRHVADLQVRRAIGAARSAIDVLGEALVAGVQVERTIRFLPRLYSEMFTPSWCRVWRRERDQETPTLVGGMGQADSADPGAAVELAWGRPRELLLDTKQRPHVACICVEAYAGLRLVVEFQLPKERSLGKEEQRLAADVALRVSEALRSAGQAAAHELQLARMQSLQEVVAAAYVQLSEAHVVATIIDEVPSRYGATASALFLAEGGGRLHARAVRGIPRSVIEAVEQTRSWMTDIARDDGEQDSLVTIERVGGDARLAAFHDALSRSGLSDHAAVIVPLSGRDQTVGLLVLTWESGLPEAIAAERDTLRAFGEYVGGALLHAREFEREQHLRERTQRMLDDERENSRQVRALHEVSRTFATSLSLDETMRAVVEAMAHRLDVDAVWIRTPSDRGDQLELRAFYASHPELSEALERMVAPPERRDDVVTASVLQTRQPVLVADGLIDESFTSSASLNRILPFLGVGSTIAVLPVAIPNEVLGTLTMLSIDPDHALTWDKVDIASGVTSQAALALDNARLYQQQKNFAEVIQESLLPGRLPDTPGLELGVLYRSATAGGAEAPLIGGDFYDFLELEDGRLAMAVGDVTGKGVGAAADTAMTKYIFRSLAREHPSPAGFLRYANEVVCEEITPGKFVTLFYALIDPVRGTIVCGNAGHPEPKIVRALAAGSGDVADIDSLGMEGLALGILPDQDYEQREYPFLMGDTLVAYTDGVVEARREGKLYGQYRLERRLIEEEGASAPQIAFAIYQDCAAYAEDGLGDDVAIVVVQRVEESEVDA